MVEPVEVQAFVARIVRARKDWDEVVAGFAQDDMVIPGFCGDWSMKDVFAHITWYERAMVKMLQARELADSLHWKLTLDERNAAIFEENKGRMLEDVLQEGTDVFATLICLLEDLTDKDLNDPTHFPGMPLEWRPWQVLASNTYEHYEGHLSHAKAWNEKRSTPKTKA